MGFMDLLFPGDKIREYAERTECRASQKQGEAIASVDKAKTQFEQSVIKLRDRKIGIINTSFTDFIKLYNKIAKINFNETDGIKELCNQLQLPAEILNAKCGTVSAPAVALTNKQEAAAFWQGTFETGLLFTPFFGPLFGGLRAMDEAEAKQQEKMAEANMKAAYVVAEKCELQVSAINAITERINRTAALLTKLNSLFRKGIEQSSIEIEKTGEDRKQYTEDQKKTLRCTISLAQTIKSILDLPLVDKENKVTEEAQRAIISAEEICLQMQNAFNNI